MFEQTNVSDRNPWGDWMARFGFAVFFTLMGGDKFPSDQQSEWFKLFQQIGIGQWFRYFTGVVEVVGAALLLVPRAVAAGVALLGVTMLSAALVWIFVIGRPLNSVFPGGCLLALLMFWWNRRDR